MRKPRYAVILFVLLVFGLSLGFPVEDIEETLYDESATPPYEGVTLFSIAAPPVAPQTTKQALNLSQSKLSTSSLFSAAAVYGANANRTASTRPLLAVFCTLLC